MKYDIQTAHGAMIALGRYDEVKWLNLNCEADTINSAADRMVGAILSQIDSEDRGEEYENEWQKLATAAKSAGIGEVFAFDERAWRIIGVTA